MTTLIEYQNSYNSLKRIMIRFQGSFSLTLVRCNDFALRSAILKTLNQELNPGHTVLTLDPETQSLHQNIIDSLGEQQPKTLILTGLESVIQLESLLAGANWKRDAIKSSLLCPLILWVTDTVLLKFNRNAPDLRSWAAPPINF